MYRHIYWVKARGKTDEWMEREGHREKRKEDKLRRKERLTRKRRGGGLCVLVSKDSFARLCVNMSSPLLTSNTLRCDILWDGDAFTDGCSRGERRAKEGLDLHADRKWRQCRDGNWPTVTPALSVFLPRPTDLVWVCPATVRYVPPSLWDLTGKWRSVKFKSPISSLTHKAHWLTALFQWALGGQRVLISLFTRLPRPSQTQSQPKPNTSGRRQSNPKGAAGKENTIFV